MFVYFRKKGAWRISYYHVACLCPLLSGMHARACVASFRLVACTLVHACMHAWCTSKIFWMAAPSSCSCIYLPIYLSILHHHHVLDRCMYLFPPPPPFFDQAYSLICSRSRCCGVLSARFQCRCVVVRG